MPVPMCSSSLMRNPLSVSRARAVRRSQRSPSSNSPVQMKTPARFTSAGEMTGSAPCPSLRSEPDAVRSALARRHQPEVLDQLDHELIALVPVKTRIREIADRLKLDISSFELVDAEHV